MKKRGKTSSIQKQVGFTDVKNATVEAATKSSSEANH